MRRLWWMLLPCVTLLGSARTERPSDAGNPGAWNGVVGVHGALRAMLREGQRGATVTLDALLPNPDIYALGALADLAGEITVIGGRAYLSYPDGADKARTETMLRTNAAATLLVVSEVPAWRTVVTDRPVRFGDLDDEIARLATAAGMRLDARFPFLMQGDFEDLRWHVIDGRRLSASGPAHGDHLATAIKTELDRAAATLIGFYSERDQGIFTHMGTRTHVHCVVDKPFSSGHVDHVTIPVGITVKFPVPAAPQPSRSPRP